MVEIGFSTGVLYKFRKPVTKKIDKFISVGATALEINMSVRDLLQFELNKEFIEKAKIFSWLSIHATWKENQSKYQKERILNKLKEFYACLDIKGVVFHPNSIINDFNLLEQSELPILMENTDSKKQFGKYPEDLQIIRDRYSFDFVFDIQHAYENDPKMKIGRKILDVYGSRLKEIHVSGSNSSCNHCPVNSADNKKSIEEILELNLPVPKISEGVIVGNIQKNLRLELEYLKSFEKEP